MSPHSVTLAAIIEHFGLPQVSLKKLFHGENQSYLLSSKTQYPEAWILKAYAPETHKKLEHEIRLVQQLIEQGLKLPDFWGKPKIFSFSKRLYTLQTCLDGQMLIQAETEHYKALGRYLNHLHQCHLDLELRPLNRASLLSDWPQLMQAPFVNSEQQIRLKHYRQALKGFEDDKNLCLLHFDAHWGNIVEKQGELYLLDWEEAGRGPAVLDLASCYIHMLKEKNHENKLQALLEGYGQDVSRKQLDLAAMLRLFHLLCKISQRLHLPLLKNADQILERYLVYMQQLCPD